MKSILSKTLLLLMLATIFSCQNNPPKQNAPQLIIYKGLYSFGPESKSFKDCLTGREYWAADSSAELELGYSQLNFEKPYTPVYVEVMGRKIKAGKDAMGIEFDSVMVVTKLIKITKDIPANMCH